MRVSTFMTADPITIGSDARLSEALLRMDDHDVRHLPVVDEGALVGVLSNRDVLDAPDGLVRDVMQKRVVTAAPDESAGSLSTEVVLRGLGCLPVVRDGELVGIVTEFDLMRVFVRSCRAGMLSGEGDPPIEQLMTRRVVGVEATDRLKDAEAVLATIDVRHAPVVQQGRLVGIISDRDLRRARGGGVAAETPVEQIMTRNVRTLTSAHPLSEAAELMTEFKFSALPIVDGEVIGILSSSDVVDHCMKMLRARK